VANPTKTQTKIVENLVQHHPMTILPHQQHQALGTNGSMEARYFHSKLDTDMVLMYDLQLLKQPLA